MIFVICLLLIVHCDEAYSKFQRWKKIAKHTLNCVIANWDYSFIYFLDFSFYYYLLLSNTVGTLTANTPKLSKHSWCLCVYRLHWHKIAWYLYRLRQAIFDVRLSLTWYATLDFILSSFSPANHTIIFHVWLIFLRGSCDERFCHFRLFSSETHFRAHVVSFSVQIITAIQYCRLLCLVFVASTAK